MTIPRCGDCKYRNPSDTGGDHSVRCLRYPPVGVRWAITIDDNWCGEFKPAVAEFVAPTIKEVSDYLLGRPSSTVNARDFWIFYDSKGWKVGKSKMKSWKAAIATWERRDEKRKQSGKQSAAERNENVSAYLDSKIRGE